MKNTIFNINYKSKNFEGVIVFSKNRLMVSIDHQKTSEPYIIQNTFDETSNELLTSVIAKIFLDKIIVSPSNDSSKYEFVIGIKDNQNTECFSRTFSIKKPKPKLKQKCIPIKIGDNLHYFANQSLSLKTIFNNSHNCKLFDFVSPRAITKKELGFNFLNQNDFLVNILYNNGISPNDSNVDFLYNVLVDAERLSKIKKLSMTFFEFYIVYDINGFSKISFVIPEDDSGYLRYSFTS